MTLKEFRKKIENSPKGKIFQYGISSPFSWRGCYADVAFELIEMNMTREEILENIKYAYKNIFFGYKGGQYRYTDNTDLHFEEGRCSWTDGEYCNNMIAKIEGTEQYSDQETKLVNLAFS